MRSLRQSLDVICLAGLFTAAGFAGTIYATDGTNLYTIDPTTAGVLTTVALTTGGSDTISGLAFDPGGTLYGLGDTIYTIDPSTGAATSFNGYSSCCGGANGLAFSGGFLYNLAGGRAFEQIDPATGNATSISDSDPIFSYTEFNGLTPSLLTNGNLLSFGYSSDLRLFSFNPALGPSPSDSLGTVTGINGFPIALASGTGGIFGIDQITGSGSGSGSGSIQTLADVLFVLSEADPSVVTDIGTLPTGTLAIAIAPDSGFSPEPSSVSLLVLGAGGLFLLRRRIFVVRRPQTANDLSDGSCTHRSE
jgi:hypothetical protein